jgi:hypothetical protein
MLVRAELDHPVDDVSPRHCQRAWILASTTKANKRRH